MLKSKIYNVVVNDVSIKCSSSIGIDKRLMEAVDIIEYEQVDVLNVRNGKRFTTYAIPIEAGISIYGAAARLVDIGDSLIILSYAAINVTLSYQPKIVRGVDNENCNSD